MPASAEHGSGWSFAMRLLSFRGALCQELDLELLGLRVQQMCSTTAMGYAVQVLVILVLPRAIMISRLSSSPLVLVTDTCTLREGDGDCFLSAPRQETLEWAALNFFEEIIGA